MEVIADMWTRWAATKISEERPTIIPYVGSDDAQERVLAKWYKKVQGRYQRGTLDTMEAQTYESLPGWTWGRSRDAEFGKKAQQWARFYKINRAPPSASTTVSKEEKALASWANRVQVSKAKGTLPEQHKIILDKTDGWVWKTPGTSVTFNKRINMWTEFIDTHQRLPDKRDGEIYQWKQRIVNDYFNGKLRSDRIEIISQLPGWSWGENDPVRMARKWASWVRLNEGNFPSPRSTTNPVEVKLGTWAYEVKMGIMNNQIDQATQEELSKITFWNNFIQAP